MTVLGVRANAARPDEFVLYPAYPNPFNPGTTLSFELPETQQVRLTVYDLRGQAVKILVDNELEAGRHTINFDGKNTGGVRLSSGIYYIVMRDKARTVSEKIILLR
jgi:flagellar hook assembly protein FlgD